MDFTMIDRNIVKFQTLTDRNFVQSTEGCGSIKIGRTLHGASADGPGPIVTWI
jgi:hypothetical protein